MVNKAGKSTSRNDKLAQTAENATEATLKELNSYLLWLPVDFLSQLIAKTKAQGR
jgi:hypothetical protein